MEYNSIGEIKSKFNVAPSAIYSCIYSKSKSRCGYMWSYEKHDKIEPYSFNNILKCKYKIYQYDFDGNFINEYDNVGEAGKKLGVDARMISKCVSGKNQSAYGFQWSYTYFEKMPRYLGSSKLPNPIFQYDLDGYYINMYSTLREASAMIGKKVSKSFYKTIDGVFYSHGYYWSYEKCNKLDDKIIKKVSTIRNPNSKTIYKYDFNGDLVDVYERVTDAMHSVGKTDRTPITRCCNGKYHTAYGFIWSYVPLSKEEVINIYHKSNDYKKNHKE